MKLNLVCKLLFLCCTILMLQSGKKYVAGPKGESGTNGKNGNANQKTVVNETVQSQTWKTNSFPKDWNANVFNDLITANVLNKGATIVYVQINGEWKMLPFDDTDIHMQASFAVGVLHLNVFKSHGVTTQPATMNLRLVIFEGK